MSRTPFDENLSAAYDRGRSAWPDVRIAIETFAERLADLNISPSGLEAWATDLYLACAAGEGDYVAIRIIDELFVARLVGRIRRLGASVDDTADVLQMVRERLFAGPHPRIRAYNASGPLEQWVKVIAIRTAIDRHRLESRTRSSSEPADSVAASPPALEEALFKIRYRAEFEQALRDQIRSLSERDRTVLRLHLYDRVSLEDIAAARGVHRVTVARWIWNAGEIVLEGLRRHFKERHGMLPRELDSLARLVGSQLGSGLRALLAGD
ncbi:MAG TPA: sigma-70 family RNA polymerase sigma factor [Polyangia bacterium]|nr:sigma-70 family RNA polymerase sigma factor [Polyangia bacterium]